VTLLVLAVDPGSVRTGFCWKLRTGDNEWPTLNKGIVKAERLHVWLDSWPEWIKVPHDRFIVACEDFIQRPDQANAREWIKQPTAKVFGAVAREAHIHGALFVPVLPQALRVGAGLAGIKWSGKSHLRDDFSAEAHATYLCVHGIPKKLRGWLD